VAGEEEDLQTLLPAPFAAQRVDVSRQLLNYWRATGAIEPVEYRNGQPWYRIADLLATEAKMRGAARAARGVPRPGAGRSTAVRHMAAAP